MFKKPEALVQIVTVMAILLGVAFGYGALNTKVEALEKESVKTEVFKSDTGKELAVVHTELHALMDHFGVRHSRREP